MIQYTGQGDEFKAIVLIFGDGKAKSLTIDTMQSPFGIKFINVPTRVVAVSESPETPPKLVSAELVQKSLIITFETAPPKTNLDYKSGVVGVPRVRLDLYFLYEPNPE
jgi:hypothetical protein